jgi:hypothetical protein
MTKKAKTEALRRAKLLTAKERAFFQKLAGLDQGVATKRAAGMLALDEGTTLVEAADRAGLTIGQIRYLAARFRQKRLAMFSDDLLIPKTAQPKAEKKVVKGKKKPAKAKKKKSKKKAAKPEKKSKKAKAKNKDKKKSKPAKKKKAKSKKKKSKK